MSQSHPRPVRGGPATRRPTGTLLAELGALVVGALGVAASFYAPWFADRFPDAPAVPAAAGFTTLTLALFVWFRRAQQASMRAAVGLAMAYAAMATAALWLWLGR